MDKYWEIRLQYVSRSFKNARKLTAILKSRSHINKHSVMSLLAPIDMTLDLVTDMQLNSFLSVYRNLKEIENLASQSIIASTMREASKKLVTSTYELKSEIQALAKEKLISKKNSKIEWKPQIIDVPPGTSNKEDRKTGTKDMLTGVFANQIADSPKAIAPENSLSESLNNIKEYLHTLRKIRATTDANAKQRKMLDAAIEKGIRAVELITEAKQELFVSRKLLVKIYEQGKK